MKQIRKKLNEIVREEGNKLVPDLFTGPILKNKYGLGDILTYNIGYRHLGAVAGASLPVLMWMQTQWGGYNMPNAIAGTIVNIPFEVVFGGLGYIVGFTADVVSKISHRNKISNK